MSAGEVQSHLGCKLTHTAANLDENEPQGVEKLRQRPRVFVTSRVGRQRRGSLTRATLERSLVAIVGTGGTPSPARNSCSSCIRTRRSAASLARSRFSEVASWRVCRRAGCSVETGGGHRQLLRLASPSLPGGFAGAPWTQDSRRREILGFRSRGFTATRVPVVFIMGARQAGAETRSET